MASKRDRMRELAAAMLRERGEPLHYSVMVAEIYPALGLPESEPPKALNTALHDDPEGRFQRIGRGTWVLAPRHG